MSRTSFISFVITFNQNLTTFGHFSPLKLIIHLKNAESQGFNAFLFKFGSAKLAEIEGIFLCNVLHI